MGVLFKPGGGSSSSSGGGGGGIIWYTSNSTPGPQTDYLTDLEFDVYPVAGGNYKFAVIDVPTSYTAGSQIFLKKGLCCVNSTDTSKRIHFKAQSWLVKAGSSLSTLANTEVSTNAEIAVVGTANLGIALTDINLTNASGQINSVAVAAGDRILVQFYRSTDTESASVQADVYFLKNSLEPIFGT